MGGWLVLLLLPSSAAARASERRRRHKFAASTIPSFPIPIQTRLPYETQWPREPPPPPPFPAQEQQRAPHAGAAGPSDMHAAQRAFAASARPPPTATTPMPPPRSLPFEGMPPPPSRPPASKQPKQQPGQQQQPRQQQQQPAPPLLPAARQARRLLLEKLEAAGVGACDDGVGVGGGGGGRWPWLAAERRDAQGRRPGMRRMGPWHACLDGPRHETRFALPLLRHASPRRPSPPLSSSPSPHACAGEPNYDPSTLHVPAAALAAMSDFVRQFWSLKARAMDLGELSRTERP